MAVAAINVLRDWIKQSNGASCACVRVRVCFLNGEGDAFVAAADARMAYRPLLGATDVPLRGRTARRRARCALSVRVVAVAPVFFFVFFGAGGRPVSCWLAAHTSGASMQRRQ